MAAAVDADSYSIHGRPIRPLPKRRLREQLSDDEAIALFASPPHSPNPAPLFRFPFPGYNDFASEHSPGEYSGASSAEIAGTEADDQSDDEDRDAASFCQPPSTAETSVGGDLGLTIDGYECAENTNNKKKRKVPSGIGAGGASGNGSGSAASSQCSGFSPNGPSNATRGRWKGYASSPRSPLAAVPSSRRPIRRIRPQRLFSRPDAQSDDKENISHQLDTEAEPPKAASFDFEYPSPVSCPPPPPLHRIPPTNNKTMSTTGTQTSPSLSAPAPPSPPKQKKPPRPRRPARRPPATYPRDHSNSQQETWICEFCEYESIFGEQPEALMRQYDIKDRRERRKELERKRLLEKVKAKGRQKRGGKKGAQGKAKGAGVEGEGVVAPPGSEVGSGTGEELEPGDHHHHHHDDHEHVCEMHRQEQVKAAAAKGGGRPAGGGSAEK